MSFADRYETKKENPPSDGKSGTRREEKEVLSHGHNEIIPKEDKPQSKREKITFESLMEFRVTPEMIREYTTEWLIDGFLVKQTLVNIYAKGGAGKSYFVVNLCKWLLDNKKVTQIFYIDGDNGLGVYSRRKLDFLLEEYENIFYIGGYVRNKKGKYLNKRYLLEDLDEDIDNRPNFLQDTLFVIDSIRDFIGGDMAKDNVVIPKLDNLKKFRENGATIIFLHHQPKQPSNPDENNQAYKGATAFNDSVDEAWYFANKTKSDDAKNKLVVTLEPQKRRDDTKPQAFIVDTAGIANLTKVDYDLYSLSEKEQITLDYAIDIINDNPSGIKSSDLIEGIRKYAKDDKVDIIANNNDLHKFLHRYNGKEYYIQKGNNFGKGRPPLYFKPLIIEQYKEFGAEEVIEFQG